MKDAVVETESSSSMVVPVLISSVVGAGLALLLAPKSGQEIRTDLKRFASRTGGQAAEISDTGTATLYGQGQPVAGSSAAETAATTQEGLSDTAGNNSRSLLIPILVSGAIGAAVALLFAPKPGSEVWEDIKDLASNSWDKMSSAYEEAKGTAKESAESAAEKLKQAA